MIFEDQRSHIYKVVDLTDSLSKKSSNEQYFFDWCHLNADGNALVANAIAKILNKN